MLKGPQSILYSSSAMLYDTLVTNTTFLSCFTELYSECAKY